MKMVSAIFLLAAKPISDLWEKFRQNTTPTRHKILRLKQEDIRVSTLDFTAYFCEIPRHVYLADKVNRGLKWLFLPISPLIGFLQPEPGCNSFFFYIKPQLSPRTPWRLFL